MAEKNFTPEQIEQVINGAADYEDGEQGTYRCCELFCEEHGLPKELGLVAAFESDKRSALAAGIPLEVITGERRLSDIFSLEYIARQMGRA